MVLHCVHGDRFYELLFKNWFYVSPAWFAKVIIP
jgi:hypothetical protein